MRNDCKIMSICVIYGTLNRCKVKRKDFLSTQRAPARETPQMKQAVLDKAAGNGTRVVDWDADTKRMTPGPSARNYESSRKKAGCHLIWNAFWAINGFCIFQMCMRDPMHQIDKGVIVTLLKAILRLYAEQIESVMNNAGSAAKKLTERLIKALGASTDAAGGR